MKHKSPARAQTTSDNGTTISRYRAQHMSLIDIAGPDFGRGAKFDETESPLVWLARRKGTDGRPLIEPHQLQAGERLRADFTLAQMMPRTTSNWHAAVAGRRRDPSEAHLTDRVIAARQRLRHALDATGPELSGLLIDICCFLKKLDVVESERRWPSRSAKVVLQLALERLARHYGLCAEIRGKSSAMMQSWSDGSTSASAAADR
jgi:hypothetical protein